MLEKKKNCFRLNNNVDACIVLCIIIIRIIYGQQLNYATPV